MSDGSPNIASHLFDRDHKAKKYNEARDRKHDTHATTQC